MLTRTRPEGLFSRKSLVALAIFTVTACTPPLTVSPISDIRAIEAQLFGDTTVIVAGSIVSAPSASATGELILQELSDKPTDTVTVILPGAYPLGARITVFGRVKPSDGLRLNRADPLVVADSVQDGILASAPNSRATLAYTMALGFSLLSCALYLGWRLGGQDWWRRRPLDLDKLRTSVDDSEGVERRREAQSALDQLHARDKAIELLIASIRERRESIGDSRGYSPADRADQRLHEQLAGGALPIDLVSQMVAVLTSDPSIGWQNAALISTASTVLFALIGFLVGAYLFYSPGKVGRAIRFSKVTSKALLVVFIASVLAYMTIRGLSIMQVQGIAEHGWVLNMGVCVLALIAGLWKAIAYHLGRGPALKDLAETLQGERTRNTEATPEFLGTAGIFINPTVGDGQDASPDRSQGGAASNANRATNGRFGHVPRTAVAMLMMAMPAITQLSAQELKPLHPANAALVNAARMVNTPPMLPASATQDRDVCPYFPDATASVSQSFRRVADSMFIATITNLLHVFGCSVVMLAPFTDDTVFWHEPPRWFPIAAPVRMVATSALCPEVAEKRKKLGLLGTQGNSVKGVTAAALKSCQLRLDESWRERLVAYHRTVDSMRGALDAIRPARPARATNLRAVMRFAVSKSYPLVIIRTDAAHTALTTGPALTIAPGTVVVLLIVPSDAAYGGAAATGVHATRVAAKTQGTLVVLPYQELAKPDIWRRIAADTRDVRKRE